jgi:hypothetical protein
LPYAGSSTWEKWIMWLLCCTLLWHTRKRKPYLWEIV